MSDTAAMRDDDTGVAERLPEAGDHRRGTGHGTRSDVLPVGRRTVAPVVS